MSETPCTIVVERVQLPAIIVHGGAGSYVQTTTQAQRAARGLAISSAAESGLQALLADGPCAAVLAAVTDMEADERFNAGYGSRLQKDGRARLSAAIMNGSRLRSSAVYNVEQCRYPSRLAAVLQDRGDRNLDGTGAMALMAELGWMPEDVRSPSAIARWEALVAGIDVVDRESAIGGAAESALVAARDAGAPVPEDLLPPSDRRYGTVGAVAAGPDGALWACTSTGGRGHEAVGRVSDSPTPTGNYACASVGLSATGFGEQILDLNVCGRIATRLLDGASLEDALRRTFGEVAAHGGLLGVIALTADGVVGYAHSTEACGIAWRDAAGAEHVDRHGRQPQA